MFFSEDETCRWVVAGEAVVDQELLLELLSGVIGGGKLSMLFRPFNNSVAVYADASSKLRERWKW
jgi:hypothetical protein